MSVDFKWQSNGGVLLDGSGDIAFTGSPRETLIDMVRSRLKADLNGWKLYQIGADLGTLVGESVQPEIELAIKRQVQASLNKDFLPAGTFDVKTLSIDTTISVYVYLQNSLLATATITRDGNTVQVSA